MARIFEPYQNYIIKQLKPIPCLSCAHRKLDFSTICNEYPERIPRTVEELKYCAFYKKEGFMK